MFRPSSNGLRRSPANRSMSFASISRCSVKCSVDPAWQDDDTRETERKEVISYAQRRIGLEESQTHLMRARLSFTSGAIASRKAPAAKNARKAPKMAKAGRPKTKREVANRSQREA